MSDPFIAEIRPFPFTFAPRGWALCDGQELLIQQNTALFSLLGTTYGGDGVRTFRLPDLRGSVPLHLGNGPGLSPRTLGESGGSSTSTLTTDQLPAHGHDLTARNGPSQTGAPENGVLAKAGWVQGQKSGVAQQYGSTAQGAKPNTTMGAQTIQPTGGTGPHENMMPYLTVKFCIAINGIYPPRP